MAAHGTLVQSAFGGNPFYVASLLILGIVFSSAGFGSCITTPDTCRLFVGRNAAGVWLAFR